MSGQVEIILGTLSKALGSVGGYIAGSRVLIDWLVNRARSFIYSTALPPGAIAASHAAITLARGAEGAALRARLRENIAHFRNALPAAWQDRAPSASAIQPLICGESSAALELAAALRDAGFFIPAIRFPDRAAPGRPPARDAERGHSGKDIDTLNKALATRQIV